VSRHTVAALRLRLHARSFGLVCTTWGASCSWRHGLARGNLRAFATYGTEDFGNTHLSYSERLWDNYCTAYLCTKQNQLSLSFSLESY
jgi:hypothetical protein